VNNKNRIFMPLLAVIIVSGHPYKVAAEKAITGPSASTKNSVQHNGAYSGTLLETLNAGGYTYVKIDYNNEPTWAAGPVTILKKGDMIGFNARMPMLNFHSKTLNRDFETIYFVDHFTVNGKRSLTAKKQNSLDPHASTKPQPKSISLKSFSKAENGQTIAEILHNKSAKTRVQIRGQVSKFTAGVMGKNWIHIRDKSTDKDLTITTDATVAIDEVIFIEGNITLNKDFGYGYVYDVIIEDAKITSQNP
jgi:hypothetical protein